MKSILLKLPYWRETLREMFFPQGCALCGKPLFRDSFYGLCKNCRNSLAIPEAERGRCSVCGQPLVSEQGTCLPCRDGPECSFDRLIALYPYMGKYKKVLGKFKFTRRLSLGNFFAEKILEGLDFLLKNEEPTEFYLVPVPPKPGKIKHSGWDQIDYLARLLRNDSIHKKAPVKLLLKRLPSVSQKELNKENRLQNLKGKIIVKDTSGFIPKTAVLFDDVYTTGATLDACAAALKSAGTERVYGICLCYD